MSDNEEMNKLIKEIEQKEGLPAGEIAEILYQTIKQGQYSFDELAKVINKSLEILDD